MDWIEIKNEIKRELLSRNLKTPLRRLNELENLEKLLTTHFNDYIKNPLEMFRKTDRKSFKNEVSTYKANGKLNGAEESLINHIYKTIYKE